jgi:hypothetical protein
METKKIENCHREGMTKPLGGSKPGEAVNLFWCRHPDKCSSKMSWGTDGSNVCLQSPLYDKQTDKNVKNGDKNEK